MPKLELWAHVSGYVFGVLAIAGNAIVIVLILARRRLHTVANCFVLSLAVADFAAGAYTFVTAGIYNDLSEVPHGRTNLIRFGVVLTGASVSNLCAMALDRYIAIVRPLRYVTFMTPGRVGGLIAAAWLAAFLRAPLFTEDISSSRVLDMVVFHVMPFLALLLATARVLLIVRSHSKRTAAVLKNLRHNYPIRSSPENGSAPEIHSPVPTREAMSAKVLVIVVSVFLVCYGLGIYSDLTRSHRLFVFYLFNVLLIANSAINPIVYARFKTDMKREMRASFRCFSKCRGTLPPGAHVVGQK